MLVCVFETIITVDNDNTKVIFLFLKNVQRIFENIQNICKIYSNKISVDVHRVVEIFSNKKHWKLPLCLLWYFENHHKRQFFFVFDILKRNSPFRLFSRNFKCLIEFLLNYGKPSEMWVISFSALIRSGFRSYSTYSPVFAGSESRDDKDT